MSKQVIHTEKAPKAIGPYSQAIHIGNLVYTAGQVRLTLLRWNWSLVVWKNRLAKC